MITWLPTVARVAHTPLGSVAAKDIDQLPRIQFLEWYQTFEAATAVMAGPLSSSAARRMPRTPMRRPLSEALKHSLFR